MIFKERQRATLGDLLKGVWSYRYFIVSSIKNEFISRFARSKFGLMWMILHPLAQVLVYALILSKIMSAKLPHVDTSYAYPIYILSGVAAWTLFSEITTKSMGVFIDNSNLLKKISFPKLTLPVIVIGVSLVNFTIFLIIMFLIFSLLGHTPYHNLYWLPVPIFITILFSIGLGIFLGILNIFIRDVSQIMEVVLQFWFWLTPIVYMPSIIPEQYRAISIINPLTPIVTAFQEILLYDKSPKLSTFTYPFILSVIFISLSLITFIKARKEMSDVL